MLTVRGTHGSTGTVDSRLELIARLMAELTGRFEDLTSLTVTQHRPEGIDRQVVDVITKDVARALEIVRAASALAHEDDAVIGDHRC